MNRINRRRNNTVTIRMNDAEYARFRKSVKTAGITQQAYIINAVDHASVPSSEQISVLKDLSCTFAEYTKQLRGLATNVNQMAHVANSMGIIPSGKELADISSQLNEYRKECAETWQSIRSSISPQKVTEQ